MTNMAAMHIYGKTLQHHLWNQKSDHLESWYAASGTQVLKSYFKWRLWGDLDILNGKVNFGSVYFYMGKR